MIVVVVIAGGVVFSAPGPVSAWSSKPHVFTYLYTTKNTKKLITTKTRAVTTLAQVFKPDSFGLSGRDVLVFSFEQRRFVAIFRASAGNASDCVKVNLCREPVNEYGPTLPRAAARMSAYSRSRASNSDNLPDMADDRR